MMSAGGLNKLMEECGECVQAAAKKAAYPNAEIHPDGRNINESLEDEIADVMGAADFVIQKFSLNREAIENRRQRKFYKFKRWDLQE